MNFKELSNNVYYLLALVLFILIIVFSTLTIKFNTTSQNKKDTIPIDLLDNRTNTGFQKGITANYSSNSSEVRNVLNNSNNTTNNNVNNVQKHNASATTYSQFPEQDVYMNPLFKEQLGQLKDRYYYDNCKYSMAPIE